MTDFLDFLVSLGKIETNIAIKRHTNFEGF